MRHVAVFTCLVLHFTSFALRAEDIFALTASSRLVRFDSKSPGTIISSVQITGQQANENIVGIDFRPNTGQLYGVGSTSRLYVIDVTSGTATQIGTGQFSTLLAGNHFSINFNPSNDLVRVVSETGQNFTVNPYTGAFAGSTSLTYPPLDPGAGTTPRIVGIGYSNNVVTATNTTLYGIDSTLNSLVTIGTQNGGVPPGNGVCYTVGKLGVLTSDIAGFDISGQTGTAYAAFAPSGSTASTLYTVDLATGTATLVGTIMAGEPVSAISAVSAPFSFDTVVLRSTNTTLGRFLSSNPNVVPRNDATITGLAANDSIRSIAYRRSTGVLYGLGVSSAANTVRIYTLDPVIGTATQITPTANSIAITAKASDQGMYFDPVADLIRIQNADGNNLSVSPTTGLLVMADTALAYGASDVNKLNGPTIGTLAYTIASGGVSKCYGIDEALNILVSEATPSAGTLATIGATKANVTGFASLDFAPNGTAFAMINSNLYTVNLTTGTATQVGATGIGGGTVRAMAILPATTLPVLQLSAANFNIVETNTAAITVTRTGQATGVVSVDYTVASGTAIAGTHFTPVSGTLTFLNNETRRTIFVPTLNDNKLDLFLTANVTLSNPVGALLGAQSAATLTIADINDIDGDGFPNDIETAAKTDPLNAASTPFGGQPAGATQPLPVTKVSVKLNFAQPTLMDSVSFGGTIPNTLTTIPAGTVFIAEVGDVNGKSGVIQVFTLDAKGKSTPKGLTLAKPLGAVSKFSVTLTKGTFAAMLTGAGLTNSNATKAPLTLNFNVYFNNTSFAAASSVQYTATMAKTGTVTLPKVVKGK